MKTLVWLFLPLFLQLSVNAQSEPRTVEVRTLCFSYSAGLKTVSLAGDAMGESQVEVKLEKYLDSNQESLTLVENKILVGKSADNGFQAWETVSVNKSLKEVLLVFFPMADAKKPYRVVAVDDSAKGFPLGSFLIANMSPSSLRFVVGEKPLEVKPGQFKLLSELENVKPNGQVAYYAYFQEEKDWKRLSTGFWSVVPRKRSFQIAYRNPKSRNVELKGYSDAFPVFKELLRKQEAAK